MGTVRAYWHHVRWGGRLGVSVKRLADCLAPSGSSLYGFPFFFPRHRVLEWRYYSTVSGRCQEEFQDFFTIRLISARDDAIMGKAKIPHLRAGFLALPTGIEPVTAP